MILERLGIGFQIERNLCLSLSDSYSRGGGAERMKKRGFWLLFFRNVCTLSSKKKKEGGERDRERRTVQFLQISDHDSHYSYSFLSHKLQSSPSIILEDLQVCLRACLALQENMFV